MMKKPFERVKRHSNKKKAVDTNIVNPVFQDFEKRKQVMDGLASRITEDFNNNGKIRQLIKECMNGCRQRIYFGTR